MDEEWKLYNFVAHERDEEIDDEYDEDIPPENDFNTMVVRELLFSEPKIEQ